MSRSFLSIVTVGLILGNGVPMIAAAAAPNAGPASISSARHWTADNGNGTYSNPLFHEEFEDPDIIRVGDDYYLAGTTMHMMPGVQIMRSKDLVNWELVGYAIDKLDLGPTYRLDGGNVYGRGIWAPCLRYHNGTFYIFSNVNGAGLQVFQSRSIRGPWEHHQIAGRHDMSVLFDDDGKIYIISGNSSPYPIEEFTPDLNGFVPGVKHQLVVPPGSRMGEGHHLYKVKGKYVDISAIPGGAVNQMVAIADSIDGPWTVTTMVDGESLGVPSGTPSKAMAGNRGLWLHQGGMVDTPTGEWWSILMSDHGSAGRMVSLAPITWDGGFPLIGLPGNLRKAPNTWVKPNTGVKQEPRPSFVRDENFNATKFNPHWQWNHVPDDTKWSLTEKRGVLRLHSLPAASFYNARNSLSQRPPAPESIMTVELDTAGMKAGDTAGLGLISTPYAWIGVVKSAAGTLLQRVNGTTGGGSRGNPVPPAVTSTIGRADPPAHLWLRMHCNFDTDQTVFSWSADGKTFIALGEPFTTTFQLTTFQGVRPALFHYTASEQPGGYVDFDNYIVEEPRARGIEREIPLGKTIALISGADGSFLATDASGAALVNVSAESSSAVPAVAKFQIIDAGLGRVALKAVNGKFVAVDNEQTVLKNLGSAQPGNAELFQWVNLMRGDTMLMSLTNHRYLATQPNTSGPVTAAALGASPARKSGAEFKWKTVD
ncbi:MAG: family 43 glycosylhydrolase [Pseudomonadota bacterium]